MLSCPSTQLRTRCRWAQAFVSSLCPSHHRRSYQFFVSFSDLDAERSAWHESAATTTRRTTADEHDAAWVSAPSADDDDSAAGADAAADAAGHQCRSAGDDAGTKSELSATADDSDAAKSCSATFSHPAARSRAGEAEGSGNR